MPMAFIDVVRVSCSQEIWGGGPELIYFGSDNGRVFQMEMGSCFGNTGNAAGNNIQASLNLAFNNSKSYRFLKKYIRTTFEITGASLAQNGGYYQFNSSYSVSYGNPASASADTNINQMSPYGGINWDSGFYWDSGLYWDGSNMTNISMTTPGDGENLSITIASSGNYFAQTRFSGALIEYIPLRQSR
jgi:hypothetical protein